VPAATPKPVAKRPGGRSARIRRAVFDATLALLTERGAKALTFEAVAAAAGVNKTTIYRNWPTRTALILAAAKDRSEALITTRSTGNVERDLVAFLKSVAANITSPLGWALVIATLNEADSPEVRGAREAFWRARFEAADDLAREALNDGRSASGTQVGAFIERLIGPLFLRVFITGAPVNDAFIRAIVRDALEARDRSERRLRARRRKGGAVLSAIGPDSTFRKRPG
jgi:AcrR family transcriptional regulator